MPVSHPVRDAWVEILPIEGLTEAAKSHPVRDAWIEITILSYSLSQSKRRIP